MAQSVIAEEARIKVVLDTSDAMRGAHQFQEAHREAQMGSAPGTEQTDQADQAKVPTEFNGTRSKKSPDTPFDPRRMGRELWHKTRGAYATVVNGQLYDQLIDSARSLGTIGIVPVGGIASAAELNRQYGPAVGAFLSKTLQNLGAPKAVAEAAIAVPHEIAEKMNQLRSWATAVAPAVDSMKALVVAKARYDGSMAPQDVADITEFGLKVYEAERLFTELDARRNMWINERVGGAIADLLNKTTVGSPGR